MKTVILDPKEFEEGGAVRKAYSGTAIDHPAKGEYPQIKKPLAIGGKLYTVTSMGAESADGCELEPVDHSAVASDNQATGPRRRGLAVRYRDHYYRIGSPVKLVGAPGGEALPESEPEPEPATRARRSRGSRTDPKAGGAAEQPPHPPAVSSAACHRCGVPLEEEVLAREPKNWRPIRAEMCGLPRETCKGCIQILVTERKRAASPNQPPPAKPLIEYTEQDWVAIGAPPGAASATDPPEFARVPLGRIRANPLNPRREFDSASLEELAASIRELGLVEPLVVFGNAERGYTLLAGERRWRAAALAGQATVPVVLRDWPDTAETLALMLAENLQRADLNPMEEARAFRQIRDLGWNQTRIAQACGKSQPRISQSIGLLDLPEPVQALIAQGKLAFAHGRALAKWAAFPAVCTQLATWAAENRWQSKALEEQALPHAHDLQGVGLVRSIGWETLFDWEQACMACPYHAFLQMPGQNNGGWCLRPDHWQELQQVILDTRSAEQREREAAMLAEHQKREARLRRESLADAPELMETGAKGGAVVEDAIEGPAQAPPEASFPHLRDLPYNTYQQLYKGDTPAGCTADCACRGLARSYDGELVPICTRPGRLNQLKGAQTRQENAARRKALNLLKAEFTANACQVSPLESRPLAWLSMKILGACSIECVRSALVAAGIALPADLWQHPNWRESIAHLDRVAALSPTELVRLMLLAAGHEEIKSGIEREHDPPNKTRWFLGLQAEPALLELPDPEALADAAP